MRTDLTDADVLTFVLAGCNASEIAAFSGTTEQVAQARIDRALAHYANPRDRLTLNRERLRDQVAP